MLLLDIADPRNPRRLGRFWASGYRVGLDVEGTTVYVPGFYEGLSILDIRDPSMIRRSGHWSSGGISVNVKLDGNRVYLADAAYGLKVLEALPPRDLPTLDFLVTDWIGKKWPAVSIDQRNPLADPDADGASNAMEFLFDTDPSTATIGAGRLPRGVIVPVAEGIYVWELEFQTGAGVPDYLWILEESEDLVRWEQVTEPHVTREAPRVRLRFSGSDKRRFLRLRM